MTGFQSKKAAAQDKLGAAPDDFYTLRHQGSLMKVYFKRLPKWGGYLATAKSDKSEYSQMLMSSENLPKFIAKAELALNKTCSEVVFDNAWTKTQEKLQAKLKEKTHDL